MSDTGKIKVPRRDTGSKVEKALATAPRDGTWHRLLDMGFTVAEQTARGYNLTIGGKAIGPWEFGYTHEIKGVDMISVLWVRSI